ncbi:MAG: Gfo/Idh/MocA family oxidoreductase [Kiritimatiellia bacterium]|jgi:predicted dehydrogenase|nr:Gfo/Idh/MocA family oxidoreductase [Kiritimatiellia bacterium]
MATHLSRRQFLAAAASVSIVPRHVFASNGRPGANGRLRIAGIGFGGMGRNNIHQIANAGHDIIALCDVDAAYAAPVVAKYPQAKFYPDYRDLLANQKDVDGVMIATPDHTHAAIAAAAIRAGKHVFVQKPLCHDIFECRELMRLAREHNTVTQMGIQGHAGPGFYLINEWINAGGIGDLLSIDAWCSLSYYPWGHASWSSLLGRKPEKGLPVPATLNWDLFLGPAPVRDYHPTYHPRLWRAWWDFGNGMMGDRGAHTLDPVFTLLGERLPVSVDATSCGLNPDTHPLSAIITFRFAAQDGKPPMILTWYEGTRPPRPPELPDDQNLPAEGGVIFNGSQAKLVCGVYGDSPRILPESAMQSFTRPPQTLPRPTGGIEGDWLNAILEGRKACADFAYSARLTELTLLGNLAKRADSRIVWDETAMRVTSNDAANAFVRLPRRPGWEL